MPKDPYRYFRAEARELLDGLGQGVLKLEQGGSPEVVPYLLRLAHTLKGAARVVKQPSIAEHAHSMEDELTPLRDGAAVASRDRIERLLALLDAIEAQLKSLDPPAPTATPSSPDVPGDALARTARDASSVQDVRAELADMDALLEGVSESIVQLRAARRAAGDLEQARSLVDLLVAQLAPTATRDLARPEASTAWARGASLAGDLRALVTRLERTVPTSIEQAEQEIQQVRDAAERLRLLPASSIFASLERATRDAAQSLAKQVTFEARGGDVRLDAHVLGKVQRALVQVVRNGVAHGVEPPAQRALAGKDPRGRVTVEVSRRGNRITFTCSDDGAGIDLAAVRRVAEHRGLSSDDTTKLGADDLIALLLRGGLTTSRAVTEVSGRGVGLDVVREVAVQLGGDVHVHSGPAEGTRIELVVPVSLASVDALLVESGGVVAAIPLEAVLRAVRLGVQEVARAPDGDTLVYEGAAVPFLSLARPLHRKEGADGRALSAVVLGRPTSRGTSQATAAGLEVAAFGVDRLVGTANVVVRPLPPLAPSDAVVVGAAVDAEGNPLLVVDPSNLVGAALRREWGGRPKEVATRPPILVIDDSLTTRMLEQSILESAGYEVDVATSAEEGLEKAQRRRYGLFLVDVEMPGMDGFAFVERTRADRRLSTTPCILVTSRNAPEDRQRGEDVGARAYVVKGEFHQGRLLETIRRLLED